MLKINFKEFDITLPSIIGIQHSHISFLTNQRIILYEMIKQEDASIFYVFHCNTILKWSDCGDY